MQEAPSIATLEPKVAPTAALQPPASQVWAYRLLWLTFIIYFASTAVGKLWDRVWHATHRFDTFWSPPHFFVFVMTVITGLLVATIALNPRLSQWFGPAVRVPIIRFKVAGSLTILGAGLVILSITIMLDNIWHTIFGLDETQWSLPHDMLGWSWLIIILGFISSRLAFRQYRAITWLTNIALAFMILEFLCPAMLGPFYLNYSPNLVHALANIPIVRTEPSAQHMYRIYLQAGLTRTTSPLFIPEVALFAGAALALLRGLDKRARLFLLVPLLWSLSLMGRDLYTILFLHYEEVRDVMDVVRVALKEPSLWLPIPILIAAVVQFGLQRSSFSPSRIWAITGFVFGLCTFFIWHTASWMVWLAFPAAITMILGAWIGKWIYGLLEKPKIESLMKFLLVTCAQLPAVLGVIDLILRRTTP